MKTNQITGRQAIKLAKEKYKNEFGKRPYNARIHIMKRYGTGNCVLLMCGDHTVEYYF